MNGDEVVLSRPTLEEIENGAVCLFGCGAAASWRISSSSTRPIVWSCTRHLSDVAGAYHVHLDFNEQSVLVEAIARLTAFDPEPPYGTIVSDSQGGLWSLWNDDLWRRADTDNDEFYAWKILAGKHGPMTVHRD